MNTDQATNATPEAVCSTAGLGPLAQAVQAVMAHQWSNNRAAMDALTRLLDLACERAVMDNEALVTLQSLTAKSERHADDLRCALEALDYCIEDSAALLSERTAQWGDYRKDRQAAMAATLEMHRAVADRLRRVLRGPNVPHKPARQGSA